jgi:hypothetical protein
MSHDHGAIGVAESNRPIRAQHTLDAMGSEELRQRAEDDSQHEKPSVRLGSGIRDSIDTIGTGENKASSRQ